MIKFILICTCVFSLQTKQLSSKSFFLEVVDPIYKDEELTNLWESLSDINNPSYEDYLKIEDYLKYGKRPYLDPLFEVAVQNGWSQAHQIDRSYSFYNRILQRIMLAGSQGEMPIIIRKALGGVSEDDLSRCIVMYVTHNPSLHPFEENAIYSNKMTTIMNELNEEGYKGHIVFRIGGYPLEHKGDLKLAHVPYSFKLLSLIEASQLGYENVLWLDCTIHPTNDLSSVFSLIEQDGFFLLRCGLLNYDYSYGIIPNKTLQNCNIQKSDLSEIVHINAPIIGLSFKKPFAHNFLKEWYQLTSETHPAMTFYPEEFLLSITGWKLGLINLKMIGEYLDQKSNTPVRPTHSPYRPFWLDKA